MPRIAGRYGQEKAAGPCRPIRMLCDNCWIDDFYQNQVRVLEALQPCVDCGALSVLDVRHVLQHEVTFTCFAQ